MADETTTAADGVGGAVRMIEALRDGRLRAVEALDICLARVEAREDEVGAWAYLDRDRARAEAEALDGHRRAGRPVGPLHGLPVGVKDIMDVRGMPCEYGTPIEKGRRPREDAAVIRRLRQAGALILGKTVTTEFAFANPAGTRNPHDLSRTPGGSSSGSAAAVADGMVPFALGTQTKGSVIRPGAFCGVVAYKPSYGSVPRTGVLADAPSLDTIGCFAASVDDVALLEHVMGPDGVDRAAGYSPGPLSATALSEPPLPPLFGFVRTPVWDRTDEATRAGFEELSAALGSQVQDVPLPSEFDSFDEWQTIIMQAEMARGLGHYADREGASQIFREWIASGRQILAHDYLLAKDWALTLRAGIEAAFDHVDAIITPAAPGEAPGPETTGDASFCSLWTMTGHPAVSLPLLTGPNGLPVGVQLIGRYGDDARLLRTARWLVKHLSKGATE